MVQIREHPVLADRLPASPPRTSTALDVHLPFRYLTLRYLTLLHVRDAVGAARAAGAQVEGLRGEDASLRAWNTVWCRVLGAPREGRETTRGPEVCVISATSSCMR